MDCEFTAILKKLANEQGKEVLLTPAKYKAFLSDYTCGEYKKESRLVLQALEAGVQKAIDAAEDIEICRKQQIRTLREEYFLAQEVAADVVNTLALVLRGYIAKPEAVPENRGQNQNNTGTGNANDSSAYAKRGVDYLMQGQLDAAIREFNEAIKLDPKNFSYYGNRGAAYVMQGKNEAAIRDLNEAIKLNSNNPSCYISRGAAYLKQDRYDEAIKDFNEAIRLNPNNSRAYGNRGKAYKAQGQYESAVKDFDEAMRLDPKNIDIAAYRFEAAQQVNLQEMKNYFQQSKKQREEEIDKFAKESFDRLESLKTGWENRWQDR